MQRLDQFMALRKMVASRSQAESYIKLGKVKVNGMLILKAGHLVNEADMIVLEQSEQYVSRAGLKLASVAHQLKINFSDKIVLDVGSSTGGFTEYALRHGAQKVVAVDVGTNQLHPSLRTNPKVELHEQTDIRNFTMQPAPDVIVIDVSFISLRNVLPAIASLASGQTQIIAMCKPQFEAGKEQLNKGVIKNDAIRRAVLKDFELWARQYFVVVAKADSSVSGAKGNQERFYVLTKAV